MLALGKLARLYQSCISVSFFDAHHYSALATPATHYQPHGQAFRCSLTGTRPGAVRESGIGNRFGSEERKALLCCLQPSSQGSSDIDDAM